MLDTIATILIKLLDVYYYMIIGYILLSWFPNARESSFGQVLSRLVEPYLSPFRKIIPPLGMIDLSPIVALVALHFAQYGVRVVANMLNNTF
ncbi:YggT family protein [Fictibacillus barbaricus]|uniref:YggT family protein n=1 Tax=Fictibacillus barbaricus TaxID=182136 RepID=A0ABU1U4U3_9BACL|nr:YggT family protein [Fictibacillus barbaricus]MDR7074489.1 YggT family protein [Fictibacillus barbaricus]